MLEHKKLSQLSWAVTKLDREEEGYERGKMFQKICKELKELSAITPEEFDDLLLFYSEVRNPIHHGVSGRMVDPSGSSKEHLENMPSTNEEMLLAHIFASAPHRREESFVDLIQDTTLPSLEFIVNFLGAHQLPRLGRSPYPSHRDA